MPNRRESRRIEWTIIAAGLSLALAMLVCAKCSPGQSVPAPSFAQPQQQQAWLVPVPARFPYLRYRVLGMGPRVEVMVPVGQPFQATVMPVAPMGGRP